LMCWPVQTDVAARLAQMPRSDMLLVPPEIQYEKPHFQYNLYQKYGFLCSISGCKCHYCSGQLPVGWKRALLDARD